MALGGAEVWGVSKMRVGRGMEGMAGSLQAFDGFLMVLAELF